MRGRCASHDSRGVEGGSYAPSPAVVEPAAAEKQDEENDDEQGIGIQESLPRARGASAGAHSVGHGRPAVCAVEDTNAFFADRWPLYQKAQAGGRFVG